MVGYFEGHFLSEFFGWVLGRFGFGCTTSLISKKQLSYHLFKVLEDPKFLSDLSVFVPKPGDCVSHDGSMGRTIYLPT